MKDVEPMRSDMAFRFLGKLSTTAIRCVNNINSGNVVCACIDAGISLIDMTSSIISCSNEFNRTTILKNQIYESKVMLDNFVNQCEKTAQLEIEYEMLLMIKTLDKVKLELKREEENMRLQVSEEKIKVIASIEFETKRNKAVQKVRLMIKDTITIATNTLDELHKSEDSEIRNRQQIAALEEQLRISTSQYSKMIKLCC